MGLFTVIRYLDDSANFGYRGEPTTEDEYKDSLIWHEERKAPSWADVQSAWDEAHRVDAMVMLRAKRNELLLASDWTQVVDAKVSTFAWAAYRQELRDLPATVTDPTQPFDWPEPPNSI